MSARGRLPPLLAILGGIAGGYYVFQPALEDLDRQKRQEQDAYLGPNLVEVPVEKTTKQKETDGGNRAESVAAR